jgi:sterol desaturase/sphingolipid hydroxylase (fatty acid hydroxylase superfamily)
MLEAIGYASFFILVPLVACVLIELLLREDRVAWRARIFGASMMLGFLPIFVFAAYGISEGWKLAGVTHPLPPVEQWAGLWAIPVTLLVADFLRYWEHRFEHRYYWHVHKVHHGPRNLHPTANWGHPLHVFPQTLLVTVPLSLLNFHSFVTPAAVAIILGIQNGLSHASLKMDYGPVGRAIVSPIFHRIHHSTDPAHHHRNFGVLTPLWDVIFRTAYWPRDEWPTVGVDDQPEPTTVKEFVLAPLSGRRALNQSVGGRANA